MDIGNFLKEKREALGLSQSEVAKYVGVSVSTVSRWESGNIKNMKRSRIFSLSKLLEISPTAIIGMEEKDRSDIPPNIVPYRPTGKVPIFGQIPAGIAKLAVEDIEGYTYVDVQDPENHFALRVNGDSMPNAGIYPGDLVIIRYQQCADNGQIVACRINGDESTLKRFTQQGDTVVLMPENPKYSPIIVSCQDFENGYASIIGVAVEVKRSLL